MKDPNFFIPENVDEFEELAISIAEGDVAMPKDASQELPSKTFLTSSKFSFPGALIFGQYSKIPPFSGF